MNPDIDPMSTSVDDIDISYPLLPAANYEMVVKSAVKAENKDKTGENIEIKWANTKPATSTKGAEIVPGQIVLTSYVGLTEKPERQSENGKTIRARTKMDIAKDITRVCKATGVTGVNPGQIAAGRVQNPLRLAGRTARVKNVKRMLAVQFLRFASMHQ